MELTKEYRYVKPSSIGLIVRYPGNKAILPESGGVVPWVGPEGRYWRKRLNTGDVVIASYPEVKEEKTEDKPRSRKNFNREEEE